jgi:hypothetical protein
MFFLIFKVNYFIGAEQSKSKMPLDKSLAYVTTRMTNSWSKVLEKLAVAQLGKEFSASLEPEDSVRCLQDTSTSHYSYLSNWSQHPPILFLLSSISILSYNICSRFSRWSPFLRVFLPMFYKQIAKSILFLWTHLSSLSKNKNHSKGKYLQRAERESVMYTGGTGPGSVCARHRTCGLNASINNRRKSEVINS